MDDMRSRIARNDIHAERLEASQVNIAPFFSSFSFFFCESKAPGENVLLMTWLLAGYV